MKNIFIYLFCVVSLLSCSKDSNSTNPDSITNENNKETNLYRTNSGSCESSPYTVKHAFGTSWSRSLPLPATGKFVEESHYVTTLDVFPGGRLWANTVTENIGAHLQRAHTIYKTYDANKTFDQLYRVYYQKQWTPAESGSIGQGSVGAIQKQELTPEKAMWFMTMMWAPGTIPARGTKFLLSANGKKVVVIAGYETGPRAQEFIGGLTPETHAWLGTNSTSQITVSYLKNQTTPIGPITCGTTPPVSNIPVLIAPSAGANVSNPVNLSWQTAVSGSSCRIQISRLNSGWSATNGFTTDGETNANTPVNYSASGLLTYTWPNVYTAVTNRPVAGNTYYWTVRSFNSATGTSVYSTVRSFKIN